MTYALDTNTIIHLLSQKQEVISQHNAALERRGRRYFDSRFLPS